MKKISLFLAFFCMAIGTKAQLSRADSLTGFDLTPLVLDLHQRNFNSEDMKHYIKQSENEFIKKKFSIHQTGGPNATASKIGSGNTIANPPCVNEGFEGIPTGYLSSPGWTAYVGANYVPPVACGGSVYTQNNITAIVAATPITDALVNNVPTSPLGGTQIIHLNKALTQLNTRIIQTFAVTPSNFLYVYAYKGWASAAFHSLCCDANGFIFNFYNCSGTLIPGLSKVILPGGNGACSPLTNWVQSTSPLAVYTPTWVVTVESLAPYIGSCVTVEVVAVNCTGATHFAYAYYDAKCADGGFVVNDNIVTTPSYTSCIPTATLSGLPGFSSFLWQGPVGSGISGLTSPSVTSSVTGNYTLTATIGTLVVTQTLNLVLNTLANVGIVGSSSVCATNSLSLQVVGGGLTSYTWSTGSVSPSLTVAPLTTNNYAVSATNSLSCISSDSKTISVFQPPSISVNASTLTACLGQSVNLSLASPAAVSYTWSTGAVTSSITVSPNVTTVFTATVSSAAGCISSTSRTITILPLPLVSVVGGSVCSGQSITFGTAATGVISYLWNNGAITPSISVTPALTTAYTLTVTNSSGCMNSAVATITVYALPQIQIVTTSQAVCSGQTVFFTVTGNNLSSFFWNTGATTQTLSVIPLQTTVYSVSVTNSEGCVTSESNTITVNPLPLVQVAASSESICAGQDVNLFANGITFSSYQWSNGLSTPSINVSPGITSQFTLTVSDGNGCTASAVKTVHVLLCTSVQTNTKLLSSNITVFPNPSSDSFLIKGFKKESGIIVDELGQIIREFELRESNNFSQSFSGFASGIYFVKTNGASIKVIVK